MPRCNPGPGPAAYKLRPLTGYKCHDFTKDRAPQFSMQRKTKVPKECPIGPGPAFCLQGTTRFGPKCPAGWTMPRKYPPPKIDCVPGPKYCPKWAHPRAPAYSIQRKYKCCVDVMPGPADYCICRKPNNWPAFTMPRKYKPRCPDLTPGPYPYVCTTIFKTKEPGYTMISKAFPKQPKPCSPGPAAYCARLPKKCMVGQAFGHRDQNIDVYYTDEDRMPACSRYRTC
ncbi:unnamed protein product [Psylliodes chrysocephalus]|uniref:Uncharacterized protein n=1 Tax=Psylliodes chrysocephalus TaxID=3402493 RepID=A0A9P0CQJ9_9CUCU|nr:unnamed protein product [Psylliodes chrysocephala]